MSGLFPTNGMHIYIGGVVADQDDDFVANDFSGQSWLEIGGLTNMGEFGDQSELISANIIPINRTKKAKGSRNAGSQALVFAADYGDAGQVALRAAEKTDDNYAIRVVFNDAPAGGTPSERIYIALVMGARYAFNEANNFNALNVALEINSNIVEVQASA